MINVSPVGRNCTKAERDAFYAYDAVTHLIRKDFIQVVFIQEHQIRAAMVNDLKEKFSHMGLVFSIGKKLLHLIEISNEISFRWSNQFRCVSPRMG